MLELPDFPKHYPACCLSISLRLFESIKDLVLNHRTTKDDEILILSVGCGTGFFEATLMTFLHEQGLTDVRVEGVELSGTETPYLADNAVHRVLGSFDVCKDAQNADVLMFVYPRKGSLVQNYLNQLHGSTSIMLWLGPRADWVEQEPALLDNAHFNGPLLLRDDILVPYETAALFINRTFMPLSGNLYLPQMASPGKGDL